MAQILELVGVSTFQTLQMVFFSTLFAVLIGFPLGILLFITGAAGIVPKPVFNMVLSRIIDILRSFTFVILILVIVPFNLFLVGTWI